MGENLGAMCMGEGKIDERVLKGGKKKSYLKGDS
jgi:hypothetical protein